MCREMGRGWFEVGGGGDTVGRQTGGELRINRDTIATGRAVELDPRNPYSEHAQRRRAQMTSRGRQVV